MPRTRFEHLLDLPPESSLLGFTPKTFDDLPSLMLTREHQGWTRVWEIMFRMRRDYSVESSYVGTVKHPTLDRAYHVFDTWGDKESRDQILPANLSDFERIGQVPPFSLSLTEEDQNILLNQLGHILRSTDMDTPEEDLDHTVAEILQGEFCEDPPAWYTFAVYHAGGQLLAVTYVQRGTMLRSLQMVHTLSQAVAKLAEAAKIHAELRKPNPECILGQV